MSERKSLILEQLINSILCLLMAVPLFWLLDTYTMLSTEHLLSYLCVFLCAGILLLALDKAKSLYWVTAFVPLAVLLIFRDLQLFVNCLVAYIAFVLLTLLYGWKQRRIVMSAVALGLLVACLFAGGIPKTVSASLIGLLALNIAMYVTTNLRYALTVVVLLECISLLISVDGARRVVEAISKATDHAMQAVEYRLDGVRYYYGGFDRGNYTGYGEPAGMLDSLNLRHREELQIEVNGEIRSIYLKGASYAELTAEGVAARVDETPSDNAWFASYLNALYRSEITKEEAQCFSKILDADVTYEYIRTKDILRSSNLLVLEDDSNGEVLKKGHQYSFKYVALDPANPYLVSTLKAGAGDWASYETIRKYAEELYPINFSKIMDEETYEQARADYAAVGSDERYLDTSLASDRTRELAEDLTKDCETDYEKAKAIESYLRKYTYDTEVNFRGSENYIDAFLFEDQKGYCVHYTTAMVELLRCAGVPARFTKGFNHHFAKGKTVYSNESHAWPEVFIDGYGWMVFEPTGIYRNASGERWGLLVEGEKTTEAEAVERSTARTSDPEQYRVDTATGRSDALHVFKQFGIYVLGLLLLVAIFVLWFLLFDAIRYRRMNPYERVCSDVAKLCRKLDRHLPEGEKAASVFDYIPYVIVENVDLHAVFTTYYEIRFRGDTPDDQYVEMLHRLTRRRFRRRESVKKTDNVI